MEKLVCKTQKNYNLISNKEYPIVIDLVVKTVKNC
jgi:hypothetical protein